MSLKRRHVALFFASMAAIAVSVSGQEKTPPAVEYPRPDLSGETAREVVRVADVNRVVVRVDGEEVEIRLHGVSPIRDAEKVGELTTDVGWLAASNLLRGESVYLLNRASHHVGDATIEVASMYRAPDGLFVNLELIRQGYARSDLNAGDELVKVFGRFEDRARSLEKGMWGSARIPLAAASKRVTDGSAQGAPSKPVSDSMIVYVTKSGSKYHLEGCGHLRNSRIPTKLGEARKKYEPCKTCRPPK
jgi:endonuclease YncB( thermonuclease family)